MEWVIGIGVVIALIQYFEKQEKSNVIIKEIDKNNCNHKWVSTPFFDNGYVKCMQCGKEIDKAQHDYVYCTHDWNFQHKAENSGRSFYKCSKCNRTGVKEPDENDIHSRD
jgi:DNA-directed RNA polymerase subunit RPC12/RpoP